MKRFQAYIFCTLYLFSTTEAYQLLKLPVILQHFHQHQKENKDITLLEFLDIHYMHGSPRDDDYEQDMQLPFKRVNHLIHMTPAHVKDLASTILTVKPPIKETSFIILDDNSIRSSFLSSIFHPPKA